MQEIPTMALLKRVERERTLVIGKCSKKWLQTYSGELGEIQMNQLKDPPLSSVNDLE